MPSDPRTSVVGFVAPVVAESRHHRIDLNEIVGLTEAGALAGRFLVTVEGLSPAALDLRAGDLAVVDCTRTPEARDLVVVERDGLLAMASGDCGEAVFGVVTHFLVGAR